MLLHVAFNDSAVRDGTLLFAVLTAANMAMVNSCSVSEPLSVPIHLLHKRDCDYICLQAKVKEPELYELHDRVTQIRKEMNGMDSTEKHQMVQNGVAAQ